MYKNGCAIERILRHKLCKNDFDNLLFWSDSICHLDNEKPQFKHFIIGQEWLYTMNHPQRQLDCRIHFNSILDIECIGDIAMFLTCQITRNYNHICVKFISKQIQQQQQQQRKTVKSVKNTKQNVKFTDKIEKVEKEFAIIDDVNIDQQAGILNSKVTENDHDPVISVIRKLHIYLTDTNFIGFDILQKSINRWYYSNKQFKHMITNLMNLPHFQLVQTSSIKQFLSSSSSSSSPSLEEDNIEGLIAKATRKNTIIYSTTADNEDLQQLMNMFKPFCKNVTMDTSNTQMNNHMDTFTIYINKLDHWINKTKMINEFIHKKQINLNIIHLINEQLNQLDHNLTIILDKYPFDVSIRLSNQLITIMELLLTQVTFTLPAQPIYLGNKETQMCVELEDRDKHIIGTQSRQTTSDRMKLVIHLMKIINLLLSYILPIFTQSNRNLSLLNKDKITITVNEKVMRKKLEKVISHLIKHLVQLPCVIDDFSLDVLYKESTQQPNCFQIELETWIQRYEMERLDIMSKEYVHVDQWLQDISEKDPYAITVSTIRSIFNDHPEIGIFIHQFNDQINCFFSELILNTSHLSIILNRTNNLNGIVHQDDWIKLIIHNMIIMKSNKSIIYLLNCLLAHAFTTFNIMNSKKLTSTTHTTHTTNANTNTHTTHTTNANTTTHNTTTNTTSASTNTHTTTTTTTSSSSNMEQKEESISTIIRSLFIIDWFTEQYPYLIDTLMNIDYKDLLYIFNINSIISITDKFNEISPMNLIQIKLIKCILIALISRLYEKLNIISEISQNNVT
ncbi:unnamed protein product [Schistosoma curassoni]|nr:unnamed protein product [Schistosoma curassoni]